MILHKNEFGVRPLELILQKQTIPSLKEESKELVKFVLQKIVFSFFQKGEGNLNILRNASDKEAQFFQTIIMAEIKVFGLQLSNIVDIGDTEQKNLEEKDPENNPIEVESSNDDLKFPI